MTLKEIQEKYYPIPDGNLTKQQHGYHKRMSAVQACAFQQGYGEALKDCERDIDELRLENDDLIKKVIRLTSDVERLQHENKSLTANVISYLDSVIVMLDNVDESMTHRERNFYQRSIVRYIGKLRKKLNEMLEPTPF